MDKATRNDIQRSTQAARALLERAFGEQLEGTYDILLDGTIAAQAGGHLNDHQKVIREKLVATMAHKRSTGMSGSAAVQAYLREAAFTTLNRFVALKMLEARGLVLECVSKGEDSSGFRNEFAALAPGLVAVRDKGYRLYIETLFDEIGREVKVLFDRRDVASLLWPDRQTLLELLGILNAPELAGVWAEDETIGWVYQYFNGDEERTRMRAESQAPRNSRELAVRNQFFTPLYVVQFLTDNTLGRTWCEMMQGATKLADLDYLVCRPNEVFLAEGESAPESDTDDSELSQEELLRQTVYVPFRAKKDPRDLRILDPACGSGHFLLYAFDLLVSIYEEAWSDAKAAAFTVTGKQLRADYGSIEDLRRAMPGLILRHNLHGVDIDPRAAQIAALALWMRAQRAYNQFEVDRDRRPPITKTNIVVAEPMPGDTELVEEFAASLKPAVLGNLFKKMVEEMKLAGELGSLLKIEESIATAVKDAAQAHRQEGLFAEKIESTDFWDTADEKIIVALRDFAASAAGSAGIRRQLFAGDAAQGVAFIELVRKRFDVVLMNPPFGGFTHRAQLYIDRQLVEGRNDSYSAVVLRGRAVLHSSGFLGAITSRAFIIGRGLRRFREALLRQASHRPKLLVDLGAGVLDGAMVETAAYVLDFAAQELEVAVVEEPSIRSRFMSDGVSTLDEWRVFPHDHLRRLPMMQFIYSLTQEASQSLLAPARTIQPHIGRVTKGLSSGDNFRFLRLRWEVPDTHVGHKWQLCAKGGEYAWFSSDLHLVVNREREGSEMAARAEQTDGNPARTRQSSTYYGRPAATWSCRSQKGFSMRRLRSGACFLHKSGVILPGNVPENVPEEEWISTLIAALASDRYQRLVAAQSRFGAYETGAIGRLPAPNEALCRNSDAWEAPLECADKLDRHDETSQLFSVPPPLDWRPAEEMQRALGRLDEGLIEYGLKLDAEVRRNELSRASARAKELEPHEAWTSFVIGIAFGRWDGTVGTIDRAPCRLFDAVPQGSATAVSAPGIFSDDPGSPQDLVAVVSGICGHIAAVHALPSDWFAGSTKLRAYFTKSFFGRHKRRYSRSQRSAPIYWQLATPSASYSVWCYYHRLTSDTFFRVANDYVTPKVDHEERRLNTLRQEAGSEPSSKQRKAIDAHETFVAELRAFLTEVKRIAPLWNPNLNDGVIINIAPLWRLVPQHKPWQKECKKVWDKLVKGDYDWAYLAMHLWPERVVPKCKDDRSLAIAHGLEEEFWYEDDGGKWLKRQVSPDRIDALVAERSSTAVKSALKDLLDAPTPTGQTRRKRRARI